MNLIFFEGVFDKILIAKPETSLKTVYNLKRLQKKPSPIIKNFFKSLVDTSVTTQSSIVDVVNADLTSIVKNTRYDQIPGRLQDNRSRSTTIKLDIEVISKKFSFFTDEKVKKWLSRFTDQDVEQLKAILNFLYKMVEYARLIDKLNKDKELSDVYDKDTLLLCLLKDEFPDIVDDNPIQLDTASMENVKSLFPGCVNTSAYHTLLMANQRGHEEVSLVTFNGVVLFGLREEQREKLIEIDSFIKESLARKTSPEEIAQKVAQILIDWDPGRGKTLLCELVTKAYGQIFNDHNKNLMVDGKCFGVALNDVAHPVINIQWLSLKDITEEEGIDLDAAIKERIEKMIRSAPTNGKITIIIDEYPAMAYAQQKVINKLLPPDRYNLIFISATNNSVVQHKKTAPEEYTDENRLQREHYSIHSIEVKPAVQNIETFIENYNGEIPVIVKNGFNYYIIGYSNSNNKVSYKLDMSLQVNKDLISNIQWTSKPQPILNVSILKTAQQLIRDQKLHYPLVPSQKLELTRVAFYKQLKLKQTTDKLDIKCIDKDEDSLLESLIKNTKLKLGENPNVKGDIQYILPDMTTKEQKAFIDNLKTRMNELGVDAILYQEREMTLEGEEVVKIKYIRKIQDRYVVETLKDDERDIPGFTKKNRCLQIFSKANAVGGDYRDRARNVALQIIHSNSYLSYDQLMQYGNRHRTNEPAVEIYKQHETIILSKASGIEELIAAAQRKQNNYEYKNALNAFRSDIIRSLFPPMGHELYDVINCPQAVKLIMNHIRDTQNPDLASVLQFIKKQLIAAEANYKYLSKKVYQSFATLIQYYDTLATANRQKIESMISEDIDRYKGCLHEMGSIDYMPQERAAIGGGGKITKLGIDLTDELDSKEKLDGKRERLYVHKTGKGNINTPELVNGFNTEYLSCLRKMTKVCEKISSQYSELYPDKKDASVKGSEALNFDQCLSQFHALAKAKRGCTKIIESKLQDLIQIHSPSNEKDIKRKGKEISLLQVKAKEIDSKILSNISQHFDRVIKLLRAKAEMVAGATDQEIALNLQNLLLLQKYKNWSILSEDQFQQLKTAYIDILDKQLALQTPIDNHKAILTSQINGWLAEFKDSQDLDGKILYKPQELRLALQGRSAAVELAAQHEAGSRSILKKEQKKRLSLELQKLQTEESLGRTTLQQGQAMKHLELEKEQINTRMALELKQLEATDSLFRQELEQKQEAERRSLKQEAKAEKRSIVELEQKLASNIQELQRTEERLRQTFTEEEASSRNRLKLIAVTQGLLTKQLEDLQKIQVDTRIQLELQELEATESLFRDGLAAEKKMERKSLKDAEVLQRQIASNIQELRKTEELIRQELTAEETTDINGLQMAEAMHKQEMITKSLEDLQEVQEKNMRALLEKEQAYTSVELGLEQLKATDSLFRQELAKEQNKERQALKKQETEGASLRLELERKIQELQQSERLARQTLTELEASGRNTLKEVATETQQTLAKHQEEIQRLQQELTKLREPSTLRTAARISLMQLRRRKKTDKAEDHNTTLATDNLLGEQLLSELGTELDVSPASPEDISQQSVVRKKVQLIRKMRAEDPIPTPAALSEDADVAANQLLSDYLQGRSMGTSDGKATGRLRRARLTGRRADASSITPPVAKGSPRSPRK